MAPRPRTSRPPRLGSARRALLPSAPQEWTRRKLQVLLGISALVVLGLLTGAALSVSALLRDQPTEEVPVSVPGHARAGSGADDLAAAELPTGSLDDAQPGPLSTQTAQTIEVPTSTTTGPAGVPSGFPRTPEGALAQLIAIDRAAIEPAQVGRAQEVIEAWAVPGGPDAESWSGVAAVATLLGAAGHPATGSPDMQVRLEPAMGFIKGTVGDDFVIPCIDFVVVATTTEVNRVAVADCQRMVWEDDRWVIGPGLEPAPAPSLWPGSEASIEAGYQWLEAPPWTE